MSRSALAPARILAVVTLVLLAVVTPPLGAQVGASTDIITGRVLGQDSLPIQGARIEVQSAETRVTKRATTRADGGFSVLFRDGGGQYQLQATYIGMSPAKLVVQRRGDEDRIVVTIRMSRNPQQLAAVEVKGKSGAPAPPPPPAAGSIERNLPPQLLERLPINAGDLNEVAALAPGVVAVAGTDSSGASFSVAGQSASQNNKTVDGASFLFGGLPQDAVRSTKVVTNAYDVSRGQFTGGQIATTTKSGTNIFSGTANYARRDPNLTYANGPDAGFGQKYSQHTASAGIGGPILQDRMFYFASGELDQRDDPLASLLSAGDRTLANLGTTRDSVAAFASVLDRLRITRGSPLTTRRSQSEVGMLRVDYDLADAHSLMVRGDARHSSLNAMHLAPTAVGDATGELATTGLGGLAVLTSNVGNALNEARVSWSREEANGEPSVFLPTGVVSVASLSDVGTRGIATYLFGGSQALARHTRSILAEAGDEISWLTSDGAHRFKLGALLNHEAARYGATANRNGTFIYNSLADLAAGRPALFTRTLGVVDHEVGSTTTTLYLGDAWRHSASLQVAYGVRLESGRVTGMAERNALVDQAFGLRTDRAPVSTRVSPRLGFSYLLGNTIGIPTGYLRGGIGEFRGKLPLQVATAARNASGDPAEQSQVLCAGQGVPVPQWDAYASNPQAIPVACATGTSAFEPTVASVVALGSDFAAPRVWRASLGGGGRVGRVSVGLEGTLLLGYDNPVARDHNLRTTVFSTALDGRQVHAPADAIVAATAAAPLAASRLDASFGPALEIGSDLRSRTAQVTASVSGNLWRRIFGQTSYTFTRSDDQSNGYSLGGYIPTTAGDPNRAEWGVSDLERRHALLGMLNIPLRSGLELGVIARSTSGQRFTPMVSGDVNADGSRNDRAFVPDASTSDTALAGGMQRLLATTDAASRSCLLSSAGSIAARNSCVAPWTTSLDAQLTWRPGTDRLRQRLSVSLQAINTAAGLDQLLHGTDGLRGWGQASTPDRTLLLARGFDPAAKRYAYQVNEHFGSRAGGNSAFRTPFQLVMRAKVMLGTDPTANPFVTTDGKAPTVDVWKSRIAPQIPNPVKLLLDGADSLKVGLSPAQRSKLTAYNDSLVKRIDDIVTDMATLLSEAGPRPDPGVIAPKMQSKNEVLKTLIEDAVKRMRGELTPAQWEQLPERIRIPLAQPQQKPAKPDR